MANSLTKDTLLQRLGDATSTLLEMAEKAAWNRISKNCLFVLSEVENNDSGFDGQRAIRKSINDKKDPKPLSSLIPILEEMYPSIYEIDLFLYKSLRNSTIIEIQYYLKDSLEPGYGKTIVNNAPVLHCKVGIPFYIAGKKEKFDINWESGSFQHKWKTLWARLKYRLKSS